MKSFKCYKCKKEIKWVVSDDGKNYYWACKCARKGFLYTLDMPFQWRTKDYNK